MTTQTCDSCDIDGITYYFADPLSASPTVLGTPKVVEKAHYLIMSACWRGYVGEWRIESGGLYLDAISGKYALAEGKPVLADWISGKYELTPIPNPEWSPSEVNLTYEVLVNKGIVLGFRHISDSLTEHSPGVVGEAG